MAKLVTTTQDIETGVTSPKSIYSRNISCMVESVQPNWTDFSFTTGMGEKTWLLAVRLWGFFEIGVTDAANRIMLYEFFGEVASCEELLEHNELLPIRSKNYASTWQLQAQSFALQWEMNRLFVGAGRRFGMYVWNRGDKELTVMASFQISEG